MARIERITSGQLSVPRTRAPLTVASVVVASSVAWALPSTTIAPPSGSALQSVSVSALQSRREIATAASGLPSASIDPNSWNTYLVHQHVAGTDTTRTEFGAMGLHEWRSFDPLVDRTPPTRMLIVSRGGGVVRRLEIVPAADGHDVVRFALNGVNTQYDGAARRWLADRIADLKS